MRGILKTALIAMSSQYIHMSLAPWYLLESVKPVYTVYRYQMNESKNNDDAEYDAEIGHKNEDDVFVLEFTINDEYQSIIARIVESDAKILCFSCYIWNIELVIKLTEDLKIIDQSYIMILGGPEVSFSTAEILAQNPQIDYVLSGEGEYTLRALLAAIQKENAIQEEYIIQNENVVYKDSSIQMEKGIQRRNEIQIESQIVGFETTSMTALIPVDLRISIAYAEQPNAEYAIVQHLDDLPSPYSDEMLKRIRSRMVYYESSRGCPFSCSYCISSTFEGVRFFSKNRVRADLERLTHSGVSVIKFVDRTFNCNKRHLLMVFSVLGELLCVLKNPPVVHFEVSPELFGEEIFSAIEQLSETTTIQFEIGLQSLNQSTLSAINRKSIQSVAIENIKKLLMMHNVHVHLDLIAGLPYEDLTTFQKTFDTVFRLYPQQLQCGFLKLLKGSRMRKEAERYQYRFMQHTPYEVFCNNYLSYQDVCRIKAVETLVDKLFNSGRYFNAVRYFTESVYASPFVFFEKLAQYIRTIGASESLRPKTYYEILAAFSESIELGRNVDRYIDNDMDFNKERNFNRYVEGFKSEKPDKDKDKIKELICFDYFAAGEQGALPDILKNIAFYQVAGFSSLGLNLHEYLQGGGLQSFAQLPIDFISMPVKELIKKARFVLLRKNNTASPMAYSLFLFDGRAKNPVTKRLNWYESSNLFIVTDVPAKR